MAQRRRARTTGETIGGILVGFDHQIFRTTPPPNELVQKGDPIRAVAAEGGGTLAVWLPGDGSDRLGARSPSESVGDKARVTDAPTTMIGLGPLRAAPAGLPDPNLVPPTVAESRDPFAALRVVDLLARIERGRQIRLEDIAAHLDATYLDWLFPIPVVADVVIELQANWMTDYRNASGIIVADGPHGPTLTLEDSDRVDPWIVRQSLRLHADCNERLDEFSRRDRPTSGG